MESSRGRLRRVSGVMLIAGCLAAAGCGSSGAKGGGNTTGASNATGGTTTGGNTAAAATHSGSHTAKAPIKVFVYADVTVPPPTPPETFWKDIPEASVKAINAAGGINGAKIQMTFCDSKFDPNTTLSCVKQATSGNYAAVIVPTSSVGQGGADALLAKSHLPVFYGIPAGQQIDAANAVCPTSTILGSGSGVGWMAKDLGLKKLSLTEANSPTFVAAGNYVKSSLAKVGIGVGSTVATPIGTPDLSSSFAQAMSGGANGLWYANLPPVLNPSIKQFLQSFPKDKLILQYIAYNTVQEVGAAGSGSVYFPAWTQPISSNVPGVQQFVSDMKKYASNPGEDINDSYIPGYLPMKLFAAIASTIKGSVTAPSVLAAMKSASNVSMGGLIPNYSGSMHGKAGAPCMYQDDIVPDVDKNGKLVNIDKPGSFLDAATGKLVKSPS